MIFLFEQVVRLLDFLVLRQCQRYGCWLSTIIWLVKGLLHWLTGKSEIHRLLSDPRLSLVQRCVLVKQSLKHSRSGLKVDSPAEKIAAVKQVPLELVKPVCERLRQLEELRLKTMEACERAVGKQDLETLQACFRRLLPSSQRVPKDLHNPAWIDLGFQGQNPLTDFRAMGSFGLEQLEAWSTQPDAPSLHLQATYGEYWYGTAVLSINISNWLVTELKADGLDTHIFSGVSLNELHAKAMRCFHAAWQAAKPASIMDFPPLWKRLKPHLLD